MGRIAGFARRYPVVMVTLVVGAVVLTLMGLGQGAAAQVIATVYVGVVVLFTAVDMVKDILRGHYGLDILAVVAMVATLAVGEYVASLIIVLMISGGEALEVYAASRARSELTALLDRAPSRARRILGDDRFEDVQVEEVQVDDLLLVRPFEVVPVDGILLDQEASFDESSLTGESLPVTRMPREKVTRSKAGAPVVELLLADVGDLPFEDGAFDSVVATYVLCCVPDLPLALTEIVRVLRPGGQLLLADHVRSTLWPVRLAQRALEAVTIPMQEEHFTRRPTALLEGVGLQIVESSRVTLGALERVRAVRPVPG